MEYMTDEQFKTYNQLLELADQMIKELPEEKAELFKKVKENILLKN